MKKKHTMKPQWILIFFLFSSVSYGIDISPSKNTHPDILQTPRKHWSIIPFADPKRIDKANQINFHKIQSTLKVEPNRLSLSSLKDSLTTPSLRVVLTIFNSGRRTYTFKFPDSQRFDFRIRNASNEIIYVWSEDKEFLPMVGTTILNPNDTLTYSEVVAIEELDQPLQPGTYWIDSILANYPEISTSTTLVVEP
ncbi:Intracellular proteinase inhibitor [Methylacidiphilum fumariolicum SolV]|uniref:Intracellular proteinase inhibitor n=3 Tax=Candidatus Methylacidiphilum fumarolicum TaxID=591154 RepID=I0K0X8_METFB|nr:BsuPI-related putative proteinase inhibitor [Candidatus Methylacidiphilum fumarolicum]CAI9086661.1 Intracellular proteinase inhibitor [Candidatus Methylacidiphilum fumarolicum]CCG93147.1 Intracellular proteinase inhibitor [Methylacidiphilum fumariolicum SolV]